MSNQPPSSPSPPWYNPPDTARANHGAPAQSNGWSQTPPPPPPGDPLPWVHTGAPPPPPPSPRRSGPRTVWYALAASIAVLATLVALTFVGVRGYNARHTITQPAQVGSLVLLQSQTAVAQQNAAAAIQEMQSLGATQVVVGVYGTGTAPRLVLIVAKGSPPVHTGLQLLNDATPGMRSSGWTVDTTAATVTQRDGIDYACAPAQQPTGLPLTVCVWGDVDVIGMVIDQTRSVTQATSDAEASRQAAER